MTYADKLKDPRWQKKRLEILQRDNFTCQMCHDKETTLHVHHFSYVPGGNPWDVDDYELITYCECCHALATHLNKEDRPDYVICATKRKFDTQSCLMCLLAPDDNNRCFAIFTYTNGMIEMESVITFQMLDDLVDIMSQYKEFKKSQ